MESIPNRVRVLYVGRDATAATRTAAALDAADDAFEVDPIAGSRARSDLATSGAWSTYDCVVSAYDLGSTTGIDLLRAVRETNPEQPFVLYPASGSEQVASDAMAAGVTDYVVRESTTNGDHTELVDRIRSTLTTTVPGVPADDRTRDRDDHARRTDEVPERTADRSPLGGGTADSSPLGDRTASRSQLEAFRKAVEASGHSIYCTDPDGTITYVNPTFEEVTGYTAAEAIGRTPRILKSGEHGPAFYAELWETILSGDVWRSELTNSTKRGERYVVDQTIAPVQNADGSIECFVAVNADVTAEKRRERQLRVLYESMTEWLDSGSVSELCSLVDRHLSELPGVDAHAVYRYEESSDRFVPETQADGPAATQCSRELLDANAVRFRDAFERGQSRRFEIDGDTVTNSDDTPAGLKSGLVLPVGSHGVLAVAAARIDAFDAADEAILNVFTTALSEVIDRINNAQKLQERNDRLEEFVSVVSHDLRNPLSVAKGYLELAQESGTIEHLDEVDRAHDRMTRIIDDLLWLAREGRQIGELRRSSLARLVENAWEHTQTPEATLQADCAIAVAADPDRIQQLFENLFRNAVEHAGPSVTVRVGVLGDGPDFYVEDDGPGISGDDRMQVFDAGYTTAADGTGYGLSIVDTIANAHGWELRVTESSEGGARFEFRGVEHPDAIERDRET